MLGGGGGGDQKKINEDLKSKLAEANKINEDLTISNVAFFTRLPLTFFRLL